MSGEYCDACGRFIPIDAEHICEARPGDAGAVLSDEQILRLWDTRVSEPTGKQPLTNADKIAFARAILASAPKEAVPEVERDAARDRALERQRRLVATLPQTAEQAARLKPCIARSQSADPTPVRCGHCGEIAAPGGVCAHPTTEKE